MHSGTADQYGNAIKSLFDKAKASKNEVQMAYDTEKQHILSPEDYTQCETEYKEKNEKKTKQEKEKAFKEEQLNHLKDIEKQQQAKAEAETLRDEIKAEMLSRDTEELEAGQYIIRWTSVLSQRFDSTAFKKVMPDVYKAYIKQVSSKRFSIA